jgi:hypothetical protein
LYGSYYSIQHQGKTAGADPGGAHPARAPPPLKLEKIWFFGVKSWFFTRNTPKFFALPSARRNFFKCTPPNLKSWRVSQDIVVRKKWIFDRIQLVQSINLNAYGTLKSSIFKRRQLKLYLHLILGQRRNLKSRLFKELNQPIDYTPKYTFKR